MLPNLNYKRAKNVTVEKDFRPMLNFKWLTVEFLYHSRAGIPYLALQKLAKGHEVRKFRVKLNARHNYVNMSLFALLKIEHTQERYTKKDDT